MTNSIKRKDDVGIMSYPTIKKSDEHVEKVRRRATSSLMLSGYDQVADVSQSCGSVFNQHQDGCCTHCTRSNRSVVIEARLIADHFLCPRLSGVYNSGLFGWFAWSDSNN